MFDTAGNLWAGIPEPAPSELADPFHVEQVDPLPEQATPVAQANEETPAPDTIPAPAPHPDTLSEAAGFPSPRRCPE